MTLKPPPCFQDVETKKEIQSLCRSNDIDMTLLKDLCEVLTNHAGAARRDGIMAEITEVIDRFIDRTCDDNGEDNNVSFKSSAGQLAKLR